MIVKKHFFITLILILLFKFTFAGGANVLIQPYQNISICFGTILQLNGSAGNDGDGFTWGSSPGVNFYPSNQFQNVEVSFPAPGQYQIILGAYDWMGRYGSTCKTIIVLPLPIVSLSLSFDSICNSSKNITLSGGFPLNGNYSGSGVFDNNIFNPNLTDSDTNYIFYQYVDIFGCENIDSTIVFVETCDNDIISIFPNPTNGEINFINIKDDFNYEIWISDLTGKNLLHSNLIDQKSLYLNFNSGIYWYKIIDKMGAYSMGKIILTK